MSETTELTIRPVVTDSLAVYRTVRAAGSLSAVYQAAAGHPGPVSKVDACAVLAALKADARGESHAFGIRACVGAALKGDPYAVVRHGCEVRVIR